ncbi:MAG: lytic transglycosylase domain-containing protein [Dongiaceae bacterium]
MLQGTAGRVLGLACAWRLPRLMLLAGLAALAACSGTERPTTVVHQPAPMLPGETIVADDPVAQWRPFIHEASQRYGVPEQWIREVMMQESAGQAYLDGQPITSPAGAVGLMQVMPGTYAILRQRYGLGPDPSDPHDNIMAGTAYIREMYDRYGSPGFLAAYNAGPGRLEQYLSGESRLPTETVNYVASVAPRLGNAAPATGPLAGYAVASVDMGGGFDPRRMRPAREVALVGGKPAPAGCDPLAAYDPNGPCGRGGAPVETGVAVADLTPAPASPAAPAPQPEPTLVAVELPAPAPAGKPAPPPTLVALAKPLPPPEPVPASKPALAKPAPAKPALAKPAAASASRLDQAVAFLSAPPTAKPVTMATAPAPSRVQLAAVPAAELAPVGRSAIQVGVFGNADAARAAAAKARLTGLSQLSGTQVQVAKTTPFGGNVYYMARLVGLTPGAAVDACKVLARKSIKCQVVTPIQGS